MRSWTAAAISVQVKNCSGGQGVYEEAVLNQLNVVGDHFPVYNCHKSLFTAGVLPFDTKVFEVTLSAGNDKRTDRKYKVVINHGAKINVLAPEDALCGLPH